MLQCTWLNSFETVLILNFFFFWIRLKQMQQAWMLNLTFGLQSSDRWQVEMRMVAQQDHVLSFFSLFHDVQNAKVLHPMCLHIDKSGVLAKETEKIFHLQFPCCTHVQTHRQTDGGLVIGRVFVKKPDACSHLPLRTRTV